MEAVKKITINKISKIIIIVDKYKMSLAIKNLIDNALKYGNNNKYLLSCCVVNPFIKHAANLLLNGSHSLYSIPFFTTSFSL